MARFTLFNASCTVGGGTVWAAGPYCEGGVWPVDVPEFMNETGKILSRYKDSALDAVVSLSYPTRSGLTMEGCGYRFCMSSPDGKYEYLHLLKAPEGGKIALPAPADGALLSAPVSLTEGLLVKDFSKTAEGYTLTLEGKFDEIDSVIRFARANGEEVPACKWINDTDKRIRYDGVYKYRYLRNDVESEEALGCLESDFHEFRAKGASAFLAFEGSYLEIFCNCRPNRGRAKVFIDGIFMGVMEGYSQSPATHQMLYRSPNLHSGWHTVYLVAESDDYFELDAFRITE
jgi:hypothetical protein